MTQIEIKSEEKKYFVIVPNIIYLSCDPYEISLWVAVKDYYSQHGVCKLNTDQLADLSGMSTGKVSQSRKSLIKKGFLKGWMHKDDGFSQAVYNLIIPDIWEENIKFSKEIDTIYKKIDHKNKSLHRMKASPDEGLLGKEPSPDETRKNEEQKKKGKIFKMLQDLSIFNNSLSQMVDEEIKDWDDWKSFLPDDHPDKNIKGIDAMLYACEEAIKTGAGTFKYIEKCFDNWRKGGYGYNPNAKKGQNGNQPRQSYAEQHGIPNISRGEK